MKVDRLAIPDLILVTPPRYGDARGFFSETYVRDRYAEAGIDADFVQDNHALSHPCFTLRGLHLQIPPMAQGKLVRVARGAIWDVAVDVRRGSATYGQSLGVELSAEGWEQLWIPEGFLHGYVTLVEDTEVLYKTTAPYDRAAERGVRWDDSALAIPWPVPMAQAVLSDKDRTLPLLADCPDWFSV